MFVQKWCVKLGGFIKGIDNDTQDNLSISKALLHSINIASVAID